MSTTPIADMVAAMVAEGATGGMIVLAVRGAEIARGVGVVSADSRQTNADKRRERDRLAKQEKRAKQRILGQQQASPCAASVVADKADMSADKADNAPLSKNSSLEIVGGLSKEESKKEVLLPRAKRGTRLTEDWQPTAKDLAYAGKRGLRLIDIEIEATKFRNYWLNRTDRDASKPRWDLAWQNWILNVRGSAPNGSSVIAAADRLVDKLKQWERGDEPDLLADVRGGAGAAHVRLLPSQ